MEGELEQLKKEINKAKFYVSEATESLNTGEEEEIMSAYEKISEVSKAVENAANKIKDAMLDSDTSIDEVRRWSEKHKHDSKFLRDMRVHLKQKLDEFSERESKRNHERELDKLREKHQLELELRANSKSFEQAATAKTQTVKLQKYTITPFKGEYRDWLRFWNQFTVEVDGSGISEISKFNYLLELVQGKPRDHILGLPHTIEGYEEAKKILVSTYGRDVKVHKALIKELESLPPISSTRKVQEIHDFCDKLSGLVRTLTTMKKLEGAQSFVYSILDKLGPVREALIQKDDKWEEWKLQDLVEHLRGYTDRNPLSDELSTPSNRNYTSEKKSKDNLLLAKSSEPAQKRECVYCGSCEHKTNTCTKVLDIAQRRDIIKEKRLCFNCTGAGHRATQCKSRSCRKCSGRHHTSLCDKVESTLQSTVQEPVGSSERFLSALGVSTTLHPTAVAKVNGIPARLLVDSGAGSSYICTDLLSKLNLKPSKSERRVIEQMYGTVDKRVEIYDVSLESNVIDEFHMSLRCINAEKPVLTYLPNPRIGEIKKQYRCFKRLTFSDEGTCDEKLGIQIILGAADYQRIKTNEPPILGPNPDTDPGAEFTMLGWMMTGKTKGQPSEVEKTFFLKSSQEEFEQMCTLEVLGIKDTGETQGLCHEQFKQQLKQLPDGTYSTKLPWKQDCPVLPQNKELALSRLKSTTKKLERSNKLEEYHQIMQEQLAEAILEPAPETKTGEVVHYIPHQAVIREDAESTKMRVVYDCSAKPSAEVPSLNDCLETGPALQPRIFDILLRNRMNRFCVTGDIAKAFLQIQVDPEDRDALRLFWFDNLEDRRVKAYRFTRVIFGSGPSPYILGATLERHVEQYSGTLPETVKDLLSNTYVDDVQAGADNKERLVQFKREATKIMEEGGFQLHKWHSNIPEVESRDIKQMSDEPTYAKLSMGARSTETKILGTLWNKEEDSLAVQFSRCLEKEDGKPLTKRKILSAISSIFDLLGLAAPVVITGKILYGQVCQQKLKWDEEVPEEIQKQWAKWIKALKEQPSISVPRSVVGQESSQLILHGFADASKAALSATIHILAFQPTASPQQNLLVAKARVAPKELSIPRLELAAAHLLTKLMGHVKETLKYFTIDEYHCWVDSTTVLHWIQGNGSWSQFVRNRVKAMQEKSYIQWHYVPTKENPSDLGSRGEEPKKLKEMWLNGPSWLADKKTWPTQPEISATIETNQERVQEREVQFKLNEDSEQKTEVDQLLTKYSSYWKLLRVTAYLRRFINNCRGKDRKKGQLSEEEIREAEMFWIRRAQSSKELDADNTLKKGEDGVWRCDGRVPTYHPIFIPREHGLAQHIIQQSHELTLHGGVAATMQHVRETIWIPRLRSLVRSFVRNCNLCKRYRVKPLPGAPTSKLPLHRVELLEPFEVTGVDFAGPVYYKVKKGETGSAQIALFTCSSIRAVHLKLCHDLSAKEFRRTLKEFVARRGAPKLIVSDNGKTFTATSKWLKILKKDQELAEYMGKLNMSWKFNLARSPWWGGFFERLVGVMKRSLAKSIGRRLLTFAELEEVLWDIENVMNNRPLQYLEEDFNDQQVITPNVLLRGRSVPVLEEDLELTDDSTTRVTKRMKFLKTSREHLRKRFVKEYVHALEERKQKQSRPTESVPELGRVMLIKGSPKARASWKLGRVVKQVTGLDGVVRGVKLKLGNGYTVERPLQLVCDLEVGGENHTENRSCQLNPEAREFVPQARPPRASKTAAVQLFKDIAKQDQAEDFDI